MSIDKRPHRTKRPSYLSEVKADLTDLLATNHAGDPEEAAEIAEDLWPFLSKKLAQSYWNGVAAGNRGVKPKPRARGGNAEGD